MYIYSNSNILSSHQNFQKDVTRQKNISFNGKLYLNKIPDKIVKTSETKELLSSIKGLFKDVKLNYKRKFTEKSEVPSVKEPIVAFFEGLQNEADFLKEVANKKLNNEYVNYRQLVNAEVIQKLENLKVIKPQLPWEPPRFKDGVLMDKEYENIVAKVKSAPLSILSDPEKKDILNKLAKSNFHENDIILGNVSFHGQGPKFENSSSSSLLDYDDKDGLLDKLLDFLDDLF